jgi:hypothetical protein
MTVTYTVCHFHPSLIFSSKARICLNGAPFGAPYKSRLLVSPINIRLVRMTVTYSVSHFHPGLIFSSKAGS